MLNALAVSNYRSIRGLTIPLTKLNVIAGPNGSGKSNLYRGLRLLAETSRGELVSSLAREGGLQSTFWAGPDYLSREIRSGKPAIQGAVRKDAAQLRLGFGCDDLSYAIDLGFPIPDSTSAFSLDPEIKRECIWSGPVFRRSCHLIDRRGPLLRAVDNEGNWNSVTDRVSRFESMLVEYSDPRAVPEMIAVRERVRAWRFYDHFRTDLGSPCRMPQVGTHTPVLSNDGSDLAAAIQTIREIGDPRALDTAIEDAFPGTSIAVAVANGWFEIEMTQHGLLRPLRAAELSDGTLRYLILVAALLTPRPPELLVLNEPETSLHPDLIPSLARLIINAAERSQVIVVSHSETLVDLLTVASDVTSFELQKQFGETKLVNNDLNRAIRWEWPNR